MPRLVRIPTDSDEEAMENPPPVPNDVDTEDADEARNTASPATQTYRRRTRASLITPPPSSPSVTTDTQGGNTPQETTPSTSHGQKRPRTPSPPPSPSPERQQETPRPLTPRHERVFRKKKAQPTPADGTVGETEQAPPANEPPPVAPQQEAHQDPEDVAPNQTVEARLSRIETRMHNMEHLLQLLVNYFLPADQDRQ
ncbi:extensin-like [Manihot esculenta]|uniref:extensin-like n=1 Tax=Manihot esculenta TaxID=3983 RepID=UPI000B5D932E|nr:extensin-like [Manihot esculenta]